MTVLFAGGGTGGHLYPAIAIADALRGRAKAVFVGSAERLESTIVPKAGYKLYTISAHALPRRPSPAFARAAAENLAGIAQSLRLLAAQKPDIVVATGGYVCFPVAFAARMRRFTRRSRARIVLLEPNRSPGVTARVLAPLVDEIWGECDGFNEKLRAKCRATGVPVRYAPQRLPSRISAAVRFGLDPNARTLLVIGGSQGAKTLNDAVLRLLQSHALPQGWQVLALTGAAQFAATDAALAAEARGNVVLRPYLDDMSDAYAVADLILARAGASTLGELAALAKPAILVPYPFATEAHQAANAERFEAAGAAVILSDAQLAQGDLGKALARAAAPERLAELTAGAGRLEGGDALAQILARIDALVAEEGAA